MAHNVHLTAEQRKAVVEAYEAGETSFSIAARFDITTEHVTRLYRIHRPDAARKFVQTERPEDRPGITIGLHGVSLPRLACLEAA